MKTAGISAYAVVSDFEYNGLGWQKSFTEAAGGGGTTTFWNTHDHRGRTLQVRRGTDASGGGAAYYKLRYVYHNAGTARSGSSSYRNGIVLRDADMTNGWTGASDGTLEQRRCFTARAHARLAANTSAICLVRIPRSYAASTRTLKSCEYGDAIPASCSARPFAPPQK